MQEIEIIKKIDAYVKGKLSPEEIEDLWVEFLKNPEYLSYLDTATNLNAVIQKDAKGKKGNTNHISGKGYGKWITLAASLLIIVGIVSFFILNKHQSQIESIAYINKTEFESSSVLRSTNEHLSEIKQLLNKGYHQSINEHYNQAFQTYRQIVQKYDTGLTVSKAYLNMGIIHYNNDNFQKAITSFDHAIKANETNSIIKEKAYWYKGNALIQLKKYNQALKAIQQVYNLNGLYRKPAADLLSKLDTVNT